MPVLAAIAPVFNEQTCIRQVIEEWFAELARHEPDFVLAVLDDGSTDATPFLLRALREKLGPRLEISRHANKGHGQTCLAGYRWACQRGAQWVFQFDTDGQCDPHDFGKLWARRETAEVIYGWRARREDGWRRVAASAMLRLVLPLAAGVWCADANTPYRLMKTQGMLPILQTIPAGFDLANIALAVQLRRAGWREAVVPIRFRPRCGGEPSVPLSRFAAKALELVADLRRLPPPPP